jgi:prepilin signal peptidase PulO-like enzyme (type II secretory pathway)
MVIFLVLIFGLMVGSFLNVVILRLHAGRDFVAGRSECLSCHHILGPADLVPVLSFVFLRGRCRYCRQKVSWQYPLVEAATALLFALSFYSLFNKVGVYNLAFGLELLRNWLVIAVLVIVFVYDLKWQLIPDEVVLPIIIIVIVLNLLLGRGIADMLIGFLIGFGFFAVQYFVSGGKWIGGGDLRLGALLGVLLGWQGAILALFLSYIVGAIVSIGLLMAKKATPKSQIPFGVFICPAMIFVLLWGQGLANWYFGLLF